LKCRTECIVTLKLLLTNLTVFDDLCVAFEVHDEKLAIMILIKNYKIQNIVLVQLCNAIAYEF